MEVAKIDCVMDSKKIIVCERESMMTQNNETSSPHSFMVGEKFNFSKLICKGLDEDKRTTVSKYGVLTIGLINIIHYKIMGKFYATNWPIV